MFTHEAAGQSESRISAQAKGGKPSLAPSGDLELLQGVWTMVSITSGGKPAPPEKAAFLVAGNRAGWQTPEGDLQFGLYLDSTSRPKAFDLAASTRTFEGIYALEGDTLRLCYDLAPEAKRPRRFASAAGSHQVLMVLKRQNGPDLRDFRLPDGSRAFPDLLERQSRPQPPPKAAPTPPPQVQRSGEPYQIAKPPAAGVKNKAPARVGQIIIVGNEQTPDAVILRHLPFYPGAILDYRSLQDAEKKLAALGLFVVDAKKGIRPTVTVVDDAANAGPFKDIVVKVQEEKTRAVLLHEIAEVLERMVRLNKRLYAWQQEEPAMPYKPLRDHYVAAYRNLQALQKLLAENEGQSLNRSKQEPPAGANYDGGLTGSIVVNERNFDLAGKVVSDRDLQNDPKLAKEPEQQFQIAEFYRLTGQPGAAMFYYEMISRRYPASPFARKALERWESLKRSTGN
jgi:uncharacterized protein (TIGR03067 family)